MRIVEDQVMVTEFNGEDIDPPVNAVTRIAKDHDKQSYEDQDSDPPMIEASDELSPSMSMSLPHQITVPQLPCPTELQPNQGY